MAGGLRALELGDWWEIVLFPMVRDGCWDCESVETGAITSNINFLKRRKDQMRTVGPQYVDKSLCSIESKLWACEKVTLKSLFAVFEMHCVMQKTGGNRDAASSAGSLKINFISCTLF